MSLLICLIVMVSIVLIWDWFNAPNEIASQLMNWLSKGKITRVELKKPWGCPLCMCWWISWVYLLITLPFTWHYFLIGVGLSLLNALLTKYTLYIIETIDLVLCKLLGWLQQLLK